MKHLVLLLLLAPIASGALAQEAAPEPASAPSSDAGDDAAAGLRAALARYEREPTVAEVLREANRQSRHEEPASELASRARIAGWVPSLGLKARRGQAVDLASSGGGSDESLRLSTDDDLTLEAGLTFELSRVVFAREEVAVRRQADAELRDAAARRGAIIRLYFERKRLLVERDLLDTKAPEAIARSVRILEIEALLDVFTGGAFGRMMND
jgi:hypothetical protein